MFLSIILGPVGKFSPLHHGHEFLIDSATAITMLADDTDVAVPERTCFELRSAAGARGGSGSREYTKVAHIPSPNETPSATTYPPGIPNLMPGEEITAETVAFLQQSAAAPSGHVRGAVVPDVSLVRVVAG